MYFTAFKDLAHLQKYSLNDYWETYMLLLFFLVSLLQYYVFQKCSTYCKMYFTSTKF